MLPKRPRLLFVTPATPYLSVSGSQQRSRAMLLALQEDWDVDVLHLEEGPLLQAEAAMAPGSENQMLVKAEVPGHRIPWHRFKANPELTVRVEQCLTRGLSEYQLIVGRYLWPVCQLVINRGVPVLVDLDDWKYRVDPASPWTPALTARWLRKTVARGLALRQLSRLSSAFAVSDIDADELVARLDVCVLPNVPLHVPSQVAAVPDSKTLLFVGSLWYAPNVEGIGWVLERVWPQVRQQVPDARLLIGGVAHPSVRAAWTKVPGVSAPGFIEDLAQAYAGCCGVIAPMLSGGGSNIKVLEAMAHARPCVVTHLVHQAFSKHFAPARHYLVANNEQEFVRQMVALLTGTPDRQAVADAARTAVMASYSSQQFTKVLTDSVRRYRHHGVAP